MKRSNTPLYLVRPAEPPAQEAPRERSVTPVAGWSVNFARDSLFPAPLRGNAPNASGSDAALLQRISDGDFSALGALYDLYVDDVRRFLVRATGSTADADDLTHETFLTLASVAARYDGRASVRPFLIGIAAQLVRRRSRSAARLARALASFAGFFSDASPPTPEDTSCQADERRRFDRALSRLSEEKRLAFLMVEREGMSGEEAARALDVPINTVWTRLHHARAELRRALAPGRRA